MSESLTLARSLTYSLPSPPSLSPVPPLSAPLPPSQVSSLEGELVVVKKSKDDLKRQVETSGRQIKDRLAAASGLAAVASPGDLISSAGQIGGHSDGGGQMDLMSGGATGLLFASDLADSLQVRGQNVVKTVIKTATQVVVKVVVNSVLRSG